VPFIVSVFKLILLRKAFEPILVTEVGILRVDKSQPSKAEIPIVNNEAGRVIDVILEQPENADSPIDERVDTPEKFTDDKFVHPEKAELPIDVTKLGIVMVVKAIQPEKAVLPIEVSD